MVTRKTQSNYILDDLIEYTLLSGEILVKFFQPQMSLACP